MFCVTQRPENGVAAQEMQVRSPTNPGPLSQRPILNQWSEEVAGDVFRGLLCDETARVPGQGIEELYKLTKRRAVLKVRHVSAEPWQGGAPPSAEMHLAVYSQVKHTISRQAAAKIFQCLAGTRYITQNPVARH